MPITITETPTATFIIHGQVARRTHCESCTMMTIQRIPCHELGCPDAWQDTTKECKWCPTIFLPIFKEQAFCCDECRFSYVGA